mmetsp:Transcript_71649/g.221607  ORF Transcript_71649/g.221607 Transcript_71649/m.221607 type:complete len:210 (-) Transcript_71649:199-828(-)
MLVRVRHVLPHRVEVAAAAVAGVEHLHDPDLIGPQHPRLEVLGGELRGRHGGQGALPRLALVVGLPVVGVVQDLVGLGDLGEACGAGLAVGVLVGVPAEGQGLVGLPDVQDVGVAGHAQHLVEVRVRVRPVVWRVPLLHDASAKHCGREGEHEEGTAEDVHLPQGSPDVPRLVRRRGAAAAAGALLLPLGLLGLPSLALAPPSVQHEAD